MEPEISPEQKGQLNSWAAKRDSLLSDIAVLTTEKENLTKKNLDLAASNTDIETRINQSKGRLEELEKKEMEFSGKVSSEIDSLTTQKSALESSIEGLRREIITLQTSKNLLMDTITTVKDIYERVFNRAEVLDKVVDHVTTVSRQNLKDAESLISTLKDSVQEVVDINTENVEKAQLVIDQLPRALFDLQRPSVIKAEKTI